MCCRGLIRGLSAHANTGQWHAWVTEIALKPSSLSGEGEQKVRGKCANVQENKFTAFSRKQLTISLMANEQFAVFFCWSYVFSGIRIYAYPLINIIFKMWTALSHFRDKQDRIQKLQNEVFQKFSLHIISNTRTQTEISGNPGLLRIPEVWHTGAEQGCVLVPDSPCLSHEVPCPRARWHCPTPPSAPPWPGRMKVGREQNHPESANNHLIASSVRFNNLCH